MEVLDLMWPIFAIILTGMVFGRFKILPEIAGDILVLFVFWVAIPALVFLIVAEESLDRLLQTTFYLSLGGSVATIFLIVFLGARLWRGRSLAEAAMYAFLSVGSNTAFVALPVLHAVFGQRAVLPTAIATVVMIVLVLITIILLERSQASETRSRSSLRADIRQALLNPLVLATLFGVAYAATGWPLSTGAKQYLNLLGAAVTPCALFAIGLSIRFDDIRGDAKVILLISVAKLIIFPVVFLLSALLLDLAPILVISGTICAAVPVGKTAFVLANKYRLFPGSVAAMISVSSLASVLTLSFWLLLLAHLYPGIAISGNG